MPGYNAAGTRGAGDLAGRDAPPTKMFATTRTRYGLRALCCIARQEPGTLVSSGAIAREEEIPRRYLQALLRDLSAAGLLRVVRGRAGGYTLAKSAEEITIATISEAVGDPMAPTFCLGCKRMEQGCPAHEAWGQLAQEFRRALSRITVAQLTGSPAARKAPSQPGHTGAPPGAAT